MPSYHLSQKIGYAGKAGLHARYILRIGDYAPGGSKSKGLEDLEATASGNMPAWAVVNPTYFWLAADVGEVATGVNTRPLLDDKGKALRGQDGKVIKVEQKNRGQVYKEVEVALPRELDSVQRLALVKHWIAQELGDRHAYTFAIHIKKAKLDLGNQPHLHLMYSERLLDGTARDPDQYFRRYRPKNPHKGGCQKASSRNTPQQNKDELQARRKRWAELQNEHLQAAGFYQRVDHRSNKARGILEVPERHLGPRALDRQRAEVLAERELKALVRIAKEEFYSAQMEVDMEMQAWAEAEHIVAEEQAEAEDRARFEREAQVIEHEQAQEAATATLIELDCQERSTLNPDSASMPWLSQAFLPPPMPSPADKPSLSEPQLSIEFEPEDWQEDDSMDWQSSSYDQDQDQVRDEDGNEDDSEGDSDTVADV